MLNRDVSFWDSIASHPEVGPSIFLGIEPVSLAPLVEPEDHLPMASENGGLIFSPVDHLGMIYEMHTLYKPEGWGREVAIFSRLAIDEAFNRASIIVTHEQEGNWRSKPPRSHCWQSSDDYRDVGLPVRLRMWYLTKERWLSSPSRKKIDQCL